LHIWQRNMYFMVETVAQIIGSEVITFGFKIS